MRLADKSTVCLTILLSINNEEYVGQSIRGAYHTTVSEKVSKLTALFLFFCHFFYFFYQKSLFKGYFAIQLAHSL